MRILITNDDGIHAKGLEILKAIALGISPDVWTVAPETNQSGTSHSLTLHTPLRLRTVDERTFAVAGTPTDCVIMAVRHLLKDQPPDSDPVGHQSRLEPRRRRHLFGHGRGRDGRHRAWHPLDCSVADDELRRRRQARDLGYRRSHTRHR